MNTDGANVLKTMDFNIPYELCSSIFQKIMQAMGNNTDMDIDIGNLLNNKQMNVNFNVKLNANEPTVETEIVKTEIAENDNISKDASSKDNINLEITNIQEIIPEPTHVIGTPQPIISHPPAIVMRRPQSHANKNPAIAMEKLPHPNIDLIRMKTIPFINGSFQTKKLNTFSLRKQ